MTNNSSLSNDIITKCEYKLLKKRYIEENNWIDSKIYLVFEFKKDLKTKYFTEDAALKLNYKQKDLINGKIDILMLKIFFESHQRAVKRLIIGKQMKYYK